MTSPQSSTPTLRDEYAAFISYCRGGADEKWARWLHKAIEGWKTPKSLQRGGSARVRPVFLDATEVGGQESLGTTLDKAVDVSKSFVLMCSPRIAESPYVQREVERYLRRPDRGPFVWVLVEGEPRDAIPTFARLNDGDDLPVAVDARDDPAEPLKLRQRRVLLGVLSALLDVPLGLLEDRDQQRRMRFLRRVTTAALAAVVVLAVLVAFAVHARNRAQRAEQRAATVAQRTLDLASVTVGDALTPASAPDGEVSEEMLERLRALGYLQ